MGNRKKNHRWHWNIFFATFVGAVTIDNCKPGPNHLSHVFHWLLVQNVHWPHDTRPILFFLVPLCLCQVRIESNDLPNECHEKHQTISCTCLQNVLWRRWTNTMDGTQNHSTIWWSWLSLIFSLAHQSWVPWPIQHEFLIFSMYQWQW